MATLSTPRYNFPFPSVRDDLDRWFEQFFSPALKATNGQGDTWYAPAALWEDEDNYHIELEVPGVANEDVEITYEKGALVVNAERKAPDEERKYWHNSRRYGKSRFTLQLPESVDVENIDAELKQGVLHLTLAKRPEAQPKKISVKAAE